AVVVEESIPSADRGDVEIGPAIVVVVEEYGARRGCRPGVGKADGGGRVGEGAVAVAPIEDRVGSPAEEDVVAAVAVHVADGAAGAVADRVVRAASEEPERRRPRIGVGACDAGGGRRI